jgi:hypothetical protein
VGRKVAGKERLMDLIPTDDFLFEPHQQCICSNNRHESEQYTDDEAVWFLGYELECQCLNFYH